MTGAVPGEPVTTALNIDKPHPHDAVPVGCPNCGELDALVIDVPLVIHHRIRAWRIPTVTDPEVEVTESDNIDGATAAIDPVTKVRCLTCRWAYTGDRPLDRLREPS